MKSNTIISNSTACAEEALPYHLDCELITSNEEHLKWYAAMVQCSYQYHPENIVRDWEKLEAIAVVMLREWEKNQIFDWGLDVIFNLVLCLQNVQLDCK